MGTGSAAASNSPVSGQAKYGAFAKESSASSAKERGRRESSDSWQVPLIESFQVASECGDKDGIAWAVIMKVALIAFGVSRSPLADGSEWPSLAIPRGADRGRVRLCQSTSVGEVASAEDP